MATTNGMLKFNFLQKNIDRNLLNTLVEKLDKI